MTDVKPVCGYIGGKWRWADRIIPFIQKAPNKPTNYYEIFGGMGGVLISKPPHHLEVWNDIDSNLYAFWRCMVDPELFKHLDEMAKFDVHSYEFFHWMKNREIPEWDLVSRAYQMFHVLKHSYGSQGKTWSRKVIRKGPTWPREVAAIFHDRVKRVTIENLSYDIFIEKYDRPFAVAYIDPPYVISTEKKHYTHNFTMDDHKKLADMLLNTKMTWVLSYDDHPLVRELYETCNFTTIDIAYGTYDSRPHGGTTPHTQELIITNFKYPKLIKLNRFFQ